VVNVDATATRAVGIYKRYGRSVPWVLHDLDLVLEPGSLTEIVGANGSGKSTLLRILVGVTRPTRGGVSTRPAAVGYVPERLPARLRMTGRTYLGHMARLRGLDDGEADARAEALAEGFALHPGLDAPIATLSKGNRQKVCLAQALLTPVGLLALDEPWNGLDPTAHEALRHELARAHQAGTAVVSTAHRVGTLAAADRTFVLTEGRLDSPARTAGAPWGPGEMAGTGFVNVELVAPHARPDSDELPPWAGVESAHRSGRIWYLAVRGQDVDWLLATALGSGWSVRRVEPAQDGPPPAQEAGL
jgi:ABC-type Mn2+/Zn2+ transport system ATPase subunit